MLLITIYSLRHSFCSCVWCWHFISQWYFSHVSLMHFVTLNIFLLVFTCIYRRTHTHYNETFRDARGIICCLLSVSLFLSSWRIVGYWSLILTLLTFNHIRRRHRRCLRKPPSHLYRLSFPFVNYCINHLIPELQSCLCEKFVISLIKEYRWRHGKGRLFFGYSRG
jgi:hypothetical protein